MTAPNKVTTTFEYDVLDRLLSQNEPGVDEKGEAVTITNSTTYSWDGNPLTKTDAKGGITKYEYNQRGLLLKVTDAQNGVTAYDYDLAGRKIAEVTPKNYNTTKSIYDMNRIEFVYDTMNRLVAKKDVYLDPVTNQGVTIYSKTCKYDNSGNLIKELDAAGYDSGTGTTLEEKINSGYGTEYIYNLANLMITSKDPVAKEHALAFTSRYEYDGLGRKISETNANRVETLYTYNDVGDILSVSLKKNPSSAPKVIKHSTYDLAGRMLSQTDGNGNTTTFEYNTMGKVRKTVAPGDSTIPSTEVTSQYDEIGQLKQQLNSMSKLDLYTYDNQGRQLSHTEKKSDNTQAITTYSIYDVNGNKFSETDGNGNVKKYKYDSLNRLVAAETTVGGREKTTTYTYDANGNKTTETDWLGNTSTNVYDPLNMLIEKRDPYTTIQKLEYNKNSKQIKSADALGNETRYIYDKNNRLIATIDPEGHTTSQSYDDVGNIIAKTNGRNITTTYRFDEFNRLIEVINPKSEKTTYTYDLNGNKLTQTDGNGNTTSYEYNAANKVIRKIDQGGRIGTPGKYTYLDAKTEKYTYFADGNMETKTDRNAKQTVYSYDIHGRLIRKAIGEAAISYTYDNNDNQLTMTDKTGTTTRTYDEENRVTTKKAPGFGTTTYTYDNPEVGGLYFETTEDFKHNLTKKVYDKVGRLYEVISEGKTTTYEYYGNGSRKTVTYSDGAKEEYTYYKDGLNKTLTNKKADGTVIDTYSYTYDEAHNQTTKTDRKGTTSYNYDSLNRLEKVTEPNGRATNYTFDKAGNRLTETILAGAASVTTTYTYNEQNRLVSTVNRSGTETITDTYRYDNNGNTVSKTTETVKPVATSTSGDFSLEKSGQSTASNVTYYKFDVWNQLIKTTAGKKTATYSYNGEGYRVSKTENERTTNYLYEVDKVVLETDVEGNETARNIYGTNLLTRTAQNDTMNYMYNGHGDVTALIGENGAIQATYYYEPSET
ncbi:RHS repeat protein [Ruminiclostridium cellulolyticum]|uniref:RHS repeat protein n=1 Tax=Ruminiclostridium cellulolyticum TaxID=1521 RepID=UPI0000E8E7C7|nr:RHS repeat protein [Ruminiclostridium cellulolyticum]